MIGGENNQILDEEYDNPDDATDDDSSDDDTEKKNIPGFNGYLLVGVVSPIIFGLFLKNRAKLHEKNRQ